MSPVPHSWSPAALQKLTSGSDTLPERLATRLSGSNGATDLPMTEAAQGMIHWAQGCAKGSVSKFRARLEWDEMTLDSVPAVLHPCPQHGIPDWVTFLGEALGQFTAGSQCPEDLRSTIPLAEIWHGFAAAAVGRLKPQAHYPMEEAAWPELVRFFTKRLMPLGGPTFYRAFDAFREAFLAKGGTSDEVWTAFLSHLRAGKAEEVLLAYPALARCLASVTLDALMCLEEMLQRVAGDAADLAVTFHDGQTVGPIARIDAGLSDRHYHGRQVMRIGFAGGITLIYKPKSIDIDELFQQLLAEVEPEMPRLFPRPLTLIRRPDYGWVECVEHARFGSPDEVATCFRRGGALLALVYALEGRDFIMDNVIATVDGPAAIDCETALQPLCVPGGAESMPRAYLLDNLLKNRDFSVLDTGMLPAWQAAGGVFHDLSGLGGQSGYTSSSQQEAWDEIGTGRLRSVRRPVHVEPEKNQVRLGDEPQHPSGYAEAVLAGFEAGYRAVVARRDRIEALLDSHRTAQVRFLFRATAIYGQVLQKLLSPECLASGLRAGMEAEVLVRPFVKAGSRPLALDLLREETAALQRWDVPCFHLPADAAPGTDALHPYFIHSPLAMARDRLKRLGGADLARQKAIVKNSLLLRPLAPAPATPGSDGISSHPWVQAACDIAELLENTEGPPCPTPSWDDANAKPEESALAGVFLYDGRPGLAILHAAIHRLTGEQPHRDRALARLTALWIDVDSPVFRRHWKALPIGGGSGLASLVYAAALCSRLLDDPALGEKAAALAADIAPSQIADDPHLDVLSGAAGAALAFLAADRLTGTAHPIFRQHAEAAGRRLLAAATPAHDWDGSIWPGPDGTRYLGYGHGVAGIGVALARLGTATGDASFTDAARSGFRLLENTFSEAKHQWPQQLGGANGQEPIFSRMESWCHGTPGLALGLMEAARLGLLERPHTAGIALRHMAALPLHPLDTVCCGNASRLEALLQHSTLPDSPQPAAADQALQNLAAAVMQRRDPLGFFRTSIKRSELYLAPAGFFRGLSGIAYQLLRLRHPEALPSVATFEI